MMTSSSTKVKVYRGQINDKLKNKSPYLKKFNEKRFGKVLPPRPVNVVDFSPHPSKDLGSLYGFLESEAEKETPSVVEMAFLRRKLRERNEKEEKDKKRKKDEETQKDDLSKKEGDSDEDNPYHLPPLMNDERRSSQDYASSQRSVSSFRSLSESKENTLKKKEWKEMSSSQRKLYSDFINKDGKDWRDSIRDRVWQSTLDRIDERVSKSDEAHMNEVANNAKEQEEERMARLLAIREEREARQKVAQQNKLTPTQIRKLAIIATKEWKKYDYATKKDEKGAQEEEIKNNKIEEENEDD